MYILYINRTNSYTYTSVRITRGFPIRKNTTPGREWSEISLCAKRVVLCQDPLPSLRELRSPLQVGKLAWVSKKTVPTTSSSRMSTDALSDRLASRLHLQQRTVGEDRIRRARDRDEDIAVFSMIPMEGDPKFRCCLGIYCLMGDPRRAEPGDDSCGCGGI